MSATINEDATKAVSNQEGEFGSHVPPKGPQTTKGHQPGQLVGKDHIPESHIQTLPPGTAPASKTYTPNANDIPGQANNPLSTHPDTEGQGATAASDTLVGPTSADVHTGLGHPGAGQTSNELRHDGEKHRAKQT